MTTQESEQMLTLAEASAYLRVSPVTLYRMLKRRELPAFKVGHVWRFDKGRLDAWLKRLEQVSEKKQ
jgi:excisionase family DNA binding protein